MSFVIYDLETTGLTKGFDQIVQVGAIRADADLNVLDQIQFCCRLLPHVIPSPRALHITGASIEDLTDPSRPSHYEMVSQLRSVLQSWCPALFLGFNSISFDEEFLRQAFYQCLYSPYLTNTQNSARADVLTLCRITAALRPDVLKPAIGDDGRRIFKLRPLAEANGIAVTRSHEALADVGTTLAICRHIKVGAPDIWSQFLRFSQKAAVDAFVKDEDAFLFSETVGNDHKARVVTRIGQHSEQAIRQYCLDLSFDLDELRGRDDEALENLCRSVNRPIRTVRTNAAPVLWSLYDATPEHLAPFDEETVLQKVAELRDDRGLMQRLCRAAQAAEPTYPPSPHVEDQLYEGGFPPREDEALMALFHSAPWDDRVSLPDRFADRRYQRLASRLVYFERPDLLPEERRVVFDREIDRRLCHPAEAPARWRSIGAALAELQGLFKEDLTSEEHQRLLALELHLLARLAGTSGSRPLAEA